jgi:hypothetical protein
VSCAASITEVAGSHVAAIRKPPLVGPRDDELVIENSVNPSRTSQSVRLTVGLTSSVSFFSCRKFAKFRPEEYDFDLFRPIRQILRNKKSTLPDFYDKFPVGSQEYRRIVCFFFFHI